MPKSQVGLQSKNIVSGSRKRVMSIDGINAMIAENQIKGLFYTKSELTKIERKTRNSSPEEQKEKSVSALAKAPQLGQKIAPATNRSRLSTATSKSPAAVPKTQNSSATPAQAERGSRGRPAGENKINKTSAKETSKSRSRSLSKKVVGNKKNTKVTNNKGEVKKDAVNKRASPVAESTPAVGTVNLPKHTKIFASQKLDEPVSKSKPVVNTVGSNNKTTSKPATPAAASSSNQLKQVTTAHIPTGTVIQSSSLPNNAPIQIKIEE